MPSLQKPQLLKCHDCIPFGILHAGLLKTLVGAHVAERDTYIFDEIFHTHNIRPSLVRPTKKSNEICERFGEDPFVSPFRDIDRTRSLAQLLSICIEK